MIVPSDNVEFKPPPDPYAGGCSSVVPKIVTPHGTVVGVPVDAQVEGSIIGEAVVFVEVKARSCALPVAVGRAVIESILKRMRVRGTPVLFVSLYLNSIVPIGALGSGLENSRTLLGARLADIF